MHEPFYSVNRRSIIGVTLEEKTWGCLKQTAIGCGVLLVLAIVLPIVLGVMMMGPFKRAIDTRLTIEERFGPQEAYVPPVSGVPTNDRIQKFIEIRRSLQAPCADLTKAEDQMRKMEAFDDQEEIDKIEVLKETFSLTRSIMGVGPVLGHVYETRNQGLLEAGMGLGEFTYIFAIAYNHRLLDEPEGDQLFGPTVTNRRVRKALLSMLENQLAASQSEGVDEHEISMLEMEIAAMQDDDRRVPWQDGLPAVITEALTPYRSELDELYCPAMAPLELMINEQFGPGVESR
jgi:hypothetical protein